MYQTPRMMVPVRTWQHRQQLVEDRRSHGEISILSVNMEAVMSLMKPAPLSGQRPLSLDPRRDMTRRGRSASDLSGVYLLPEQLKLCSWHQELIEGEYDFRFQNKMLHFCTGMF